MKRSSRDTRHYNVHIRQLAAAIGTITESTILAFRGCDPSHWTMGMFRRIQSKYVWTCRLPHPVESYRSAAAEPRRRTSLVDVLCPCKCGRNLHLRYSCTIITIIQRFRLGFGLRLSFGACLDARCTFNKWRLHNLNLLIQQRPGQGHNCFKLRVSFDVARECKVRQDNWHSHLCGFFCSCGGCGGGGGGGHCGTDPDTLCYFLGVASPFLQILLAI
jgi:hypothetical protein